MSGARYEGTWVGGLQDGFGVETYSDNSKFLFVASDMLHCPDPFRSFKRAVLVGVPFVISKTYSRIYRAYRVFFLFPINFELDKYAVA